MIYMSIFKNNYKEILDKNKILDHNYELINENIVHKKAYINWDSLLIGSGNVFGPFSHIGSEAQNKYSDTKGKIEIGNNNIFHSFTNISCPTLRGLTIVGNNNYVMSHSIIHHNCIIEDETIICSNVSIAGHVRIMNGAYLGQNSSVHQFQIIGSYAILGMNSCVIKKSTVTPGFKFAGVPCRKIGINDIALKRNNISSKFLSEEKKRFQHLKKSMKDKADFFSMENDKIYK